MNEFLKLKYSGQAVIEYILVFAFMSFIVINLVNLFAGYVGSSMGGLAYALTQQLTVGVCEQLCYLNSFGNRP